LACGICEHPLVVYHFLLNLCQDLLRSSSLSNLNNVPPIFISLRMPKQNKKGGGKDGGKSKGNGKKGDEATAEDYDDFDSMLAELRAADISSTTTATTVITMTTAIGSDRSSSSSSSDSVNEILSTLPGTEVTEAMIVQASTRGDVTQLQRRAK
jgi:hypothetical protein